MFRPDILCFSMSRTSSVRRLFSVSVMFLSLVGRLDLLYLLGPS